MTSNVKLYKCYKGSCSRCLNEEDPYITEDDYKALLDVDGKVQCPEGHMECGIQELKPEDYPKPPRDNKKLFLIGGGILIVLLIVGAILMFTGKSKPVVPPNIVNNPSSIKSPEIQTNKPPTNEKVVNHTNDAASEPKENEHNTKAIDKSTNTSSNDPAPKPPTKIAKTLKFDYGTYKGETVNGLRDGQGVMTFTQRYLISPKDLKKRYAEAGDYVSGTWVEGNIVNGKLFDKNGEQKETLIIGH